MFEAGCSSSILNDSSVELDSDRENGFENDEQNEINKKNWFGPAIASMARLNQIQANVYNMGFHNVRSLKVHHRVKPRQKPPQRNFTPSEWVPKNTDISELDDTSEQNEEDQVSYTDLQSTPPLSSASYQRNAWGSNHSIPELIVQQGKTMMKTRPSSAKIQTSSKLRQTSLRSRPHSAKEPLCSDQDEKKTKTFGVCGQRKNVLSTKPPLRKNVPPNNINDTNRGGQAWAGPPAGHTMEQVQSTQAVQKSKSGSPSPTVPPSSPEPEVMLEDNETIEKSSQIPPLLRRPLPEPIHLSLPSVYDSVDIIQDDGLAVKDDMDTERLINQADRFVNQQKLKKEEEIETEKNLLSRNTTLPAAEEREFQQLEIYDSKSQGIFHNHKRHSDEVGDVASTENGQLVNKGITINAPEKRSFKNNQLSSNKQKSTIFLTPEDIEHSYEPSTLIEERKTDKTRKNTGSESNRKENADLVNRVGVKIREDKNITVDITPRNIGRKVTDTNVASNLGSKNVMNNSQKKLNPHSLNRKDDKDLVSMVNVEYEVTNTVDTQSGKTKIRKKKTMGEVETMVSKLSELNTVDDISDDFSVSQVLHKSEGEKNYYEISRSQSQLSNHSDIVVGQDKASHNEEKIFYKTTKTIEFGGDNLQETSTKVAINNQVTTKPKTEVKHRTPKYSLPIPPSTIKHQQEREHKSKLTERKAMDNNGKNTETDLEGKDDPCIDELANLLQEAKSMAQTSLYHAAKSRPPSGKKTTPQKSTSNVAEQKLKSRPISAPPKSKSATEENKIATEKVSKRFVYSTKTTSSSCCRHLDKSVSNKKPLIINSVREMAPLKSEESHQCKKMQSRMAELGVDVDPQVLERALFAPAGESLHYEVAGNLPKNPSAGLLPHYKYWLSEDYKRIQLMEKRLAQDDHIRYLQKLAAEKKAKKAAAKENKGKKKKKKLVRRNSVV